MSKRFDEKRTKSKKATGLPLNYLHYRKSESEIRVLEFENEAAENAVLNFLGLCKRSGNLLQGEQVLKSKFAHRPAFILLIAKDASEHARSVFDDRASRNGTPAFYFADRSRLGAALGRREAVFVAVFDADMAAGLWKKLEESQTLRPWLCASNTNDVTAK